MKYYDVFEDIQKFPDADIIIAYSRRGVGKTYGALYGALERGQKVVYIKRTNKDVDLICKATKQFDTSPYKPINRDHPEYNIMPKHIDDGIGAFYQCDANGDPVGELVAYCISLNNIKSIKGFDMSDADLFIFDEFIPQATERYSANEGKALLSAYETCSRDRVERGKTPIKMLLFANAEDIYCEVVNILEVIDELAEISVSKRSYLYIEERGILLHHINEMPIEEAKKKTGLARAMRGTAWYKMSYEGEFSSNDFTNVEPRVLKKYKPLIRCFYRQSEFYVYKKDRDFYITKQKSNNYLEEYNLNRDNDIRLFYAKRCFDLQEACMNGHVKFSNYSLYDLIVHFDKRFRNVL